MKEGNLWFRRAEGEMTAMVEPGVKAGGVLGGGDIVSAKAGLPLMYGKRR